MVVCGTQFSLKSLLAEDVFKWSWKGGIRKVCTERVSWRKDSLAWQHAVLDSYFVRGVGPTFILRESKKVLGVNRRCEHCRFFKSRPQSLSESEDVFKWSWKGGIRKVCTEQVYWRKDSLVWQHTVLVFKKCQPWHHGIMVKKQCIFVDIRWGSNLECMCFRRVHFIHLTSPACPSSTTVTLTFYERYGPCVFCKLNFNSALSQFHGAGHSN